MNSGVWRYLWQRPDWPRWRFEPQRLGPLLAQVHHAQGHLMGQMRDLGFAILDQANLRVLTEDVIKTSEIEGERLSQDAVRSSLARRLGVDVGALAPSDRHVDGVVDMVLDATGRSEEQLTAARLLGWHAALFPTGYSGLSRIRAGYWRDDASSPMQVVSGPVGRRKVHYEAPPAGVVEAEMTAFLAWFNGEPQEDPVVRAGLAHLWFVTIHPFDDGNGRIARAIGDMALARAERSSRRFYSLSAQVQRERKDYYDMLERTQKATLDVTDWLEWFLGCLLRAVRGAEGTLSGVLVRARFWRRWGGEAFNARQIKLIERLLDGFEGKLTSSKWAVIAKCSPDSALRDINDLVNRGLLIRSDSGGRSTSYELKAVG